MSWRGQTVSSRTTSGGAHPPLTRGVTITKQSASKLMQEPGLPGLVLDASDVVGAERDDRAPGGLNDPSALLTTTKISVWGRWLVCAIVIGLLAYRPGFWFPEMIEYLAIPIALLIVNGAAHYQAIVNGRASRRWIGGLCTFDVALITFGVVVGGGFAGMSFLAFYPAIGYFAVVSSSPWLSGAWTIGVSIVYTLACVFAGEGIDMETGKEKQLAARIAAMLIVGLAIASLTRFERLRWQRANERERHLRERIVDISRSVHDSTAQTVSMINIGLYRARTQAESSSSELLATLESTAVLSQAAMWNLRGPIDAGQIVSDKQISRILRGHCAAFERITSLSTEFRLLGEEPTLSEETKGALFSIAHNALTNVSLHARASSVVVQLRFDNAAVELSIADDGVGLPPDFAERGSGFDNMCDEAERLNGELRVGSGAGKVGTTVICAIPSLAE